MFHNWSGRWYWPCLLCLILLVSGCSFAGQSIVQVTPTGNDATCQAADLVKNFSQIEPGASRAEARACLGQPAEVNEYELPETPFFGPSESLASILGPKTPVEEWLYYTDDQTYYLWFASPANEPREKWRLVEKAHYPTGAVFEAQ